jgi:(E)-4-hydroxy-3-methylbut-2-enyl-diphosphate synthase
MFLRDKTRAVMVGNVQIGGQNRVVVQSMTNTFTHDVKATLLQINSLYNAGAELVRIAIPDKHSLEHVASIVSDSPVPIIADIHFDHKLAIGAIEAGVAKIRINPGNMGGEDKLLEVIKKAKEFSIPIRIGVNHGSIGKSLDKISLSLKVIEEYISFFESKDFRNLVISLKSSDIISTVKMNELFSLKYDYPLHIGITEAGFGDAGLIKSSAGIGSMLIQGLGDTVRISLTGEPVKEIDAVRILLRSLDLLNEGVDIISCPTCGRTEINLEKLVKEVSDKVKKIKEPIKIAVMGCIVNGPGEADDADYGICGTKDAGMIFAKGKKVKTVPFEELVPELLKLMMSDKIEG